MLPPHKDPNNIVILRNVAKTFLLGIEGVPALRGVSLTVRRGELTVILGKSGSGKSTMLSIIGTMDKPSRGDVFLCGVRVDSRTPDAALADLRLRKVAFIFQTFNLLPQLSALENVELPMVLAGWGTPAKRRRRAIALLRRVGMGERLHHTPSMCSGGEQQRTTIARALANRPELIIADEPTGDLDGNNTAIVLKLLTDLAARRGVTIVLVTHDVGLKAYAHKVVHMLDGKVAREEAVPPFVRADALDALQSHPAVAAMGALRAARRLEKAAERAAGAASASRADSRRRRRAARGDDDDSDSSGSDDDEDGGTGADADAAAAAARIAASLSRAPPSSAAAAAGPAPAGTGSGSAARVRPAGAPAADGVPAGGAGGGFWGWLRSLGGSGSGGSGGGAGGGSASAAVVPAATATGAVAGSSSAAHLHGAGAGADSRLTSPAAGRSGAGAGDGYGDRTSSGSTGSIGSADAAASKAVASLADAASGGSLDLLAREDDAAAGIGAGSGSRPATASSVVGDAAGRAVSRSGVTLAVMPPRHRQGNHDAADADADGLRKSGTAPQSHAPGYSSAAASGGRLAVATSAGPAPMLFSPTATGTAGTGTGTAGTGTGGSMMTATSTGLSGIAAISHALFAAEALGGGATASAAAAGGAGAGGGAAAGVSGGGGSRTVVRTPASYATFTFAQTSRVQAAEEARARREAAAARERALMERVAAAAAARHAAQAAAVAGHAGAGATGQQGQAAPGAVPPQLGSPMAV